MIAIIFLLIVIDFTGHTKCTIHADDAISISEYSVPYIIIEVKYFSDDTLFVWTVSGYLEKWSGNGFIRVSDTLYDTHLTERVLLRVAPKTKRISMQDIAASGLSEYWDKVINRPRLPAGRYRINILYGISENQPPDKKWDDLVHIEKELNVYEVSETCRSAINDIRELFMSNSRDTLMQRYFSHIDNISDCAAEYYFLAIRRAWLAAERNSSEANNFMRRVGSDVIRKIPESYAAVFFLRNMNIAEKIETNNIEFSRERVERNRFIDSLGERNVLRRVSKNERTE
ncbi:MAG: hypothetical protein M5R41_13110 [Bacteroidia bacterium]|nr:hypothetical protein [Bacteroidia bacterium]